MIFVTVGTNEAPFDRLLREVAELSIPEQFVVQHGHSSPIHPPGAELVAFLSFEAMVETMRRARIVVTHGGVGSVMVALANAKRPIVVPRRKSFGEAVDDHQLQLGRRFAEAGLVTLVEEPDDLGASLLREHEAVSVAPSSSSLASDIGSFLDGVIPRTSLASSA